MSPLVLDTPYTEGTLRLAARFGEDRGESMDVLTGYLVSVCQFWCSRSEGPLYLLQTGGFDPGLEGFYILVGGPRWPWVDDPLLEPLVGKNVRVRGRLVPAGEEVQIDGDRWATYPLPALIVEEIVEIELSNCCGF